MEFVTHDLSRLTALFTFDPQGIYYPAAMAGFIGRYKFIGYPSLDQFLTSTNSGSGVELKHGVFEDTAIESFQIYRDGVVISARANTSLHDRFLEDVKNWIVEDLKGSVIQNHAQNRMYESCFIFEPAKDLFKHLSNFQKVQTKLVDMVRRNSNLKAEFQPFSFSFGADHNLIPGIRPSAFQIERWASADFSMNKFFSRAPVQTDQHVQLIELMEGLV